jgi:hypothetical protein
VAYEEVMSMAKPKSARSKRQSARQIVQKATSNDVVQTMVAQLQPGQPVPMHLWGKDHWSTFAYAEGRLVDNKGTINPQQMRGRLPGCDGGYPTRLTGGVELSDHGDYDCLFDAEEAGLLVMIGTGLHPQVQALTPLGAKVISALRTHKAAGGSFGTFRFGGE